MTDSWDRHLETLFACRACPAVEGTPVCGAVRGSRILLVGQAPGPREAGERRPFAHTAGRRLFSWFAGLGVDEARFRASVHIAAVIRCFPGKDAAGGDRVPEPEEIERCGAHLDREIEMLRPTLVLCVGTLAARVLLGESALARLVGRRHRATRAGVGFDILVLPHPSGRSTWLNREENRLLLERSLRMLKAHPAWKATFGAIPRGAGRSASRPALSKSRGVVKRRGD